MPRVQVVRKEIFGWLMEVFYRRKFDLAEEETGWQWR
jgi:hypothetical protein